MKLLLIIRNDERPFIDACLNAGHEVIVPEQYVSQGVTPVPWTDDPHATPGWLRNDLATKVQMWVAKAPQVIDRIREAAPDAIIVWTDATPMNRIAVLACKRLGIPSFELTHGCLNTYKQGHFECESYVDTILAPGQEEADFRSFYGAEAKVEVCGKPSFDWMASADRLAMRQQIRDGFRIDPRRPLIVYGMTWRHPFSTWERDKDAGFGTVMEAFMNLQPVCRPFLVVKPHYSIASPETVEKVKTMLEENGVTDFGILCGPTRSILPAADLLVSHKSSLLVEGVLLDVPSVGFDFRERNDFDFYRCRGIEWVDKRDELIESMARCLLDRKTKERLATERQAAKHYFNGPNDGKAALRCVDAVEAAVLARRAA